VLFEAVETSEHLEVTAPDPDNPDEGDANRFSLWDEN
jgi:hypothetical protein